MDITISGDHEVIQNLRALSVSVGARLVERTGRAALKPVLADAKSLVPRDTGALKQSLGVKKAKRVPKGEVVLSVGARRGFEFTDAQGNKQDPFFYAGPVEYGHVIVWQGKVIGKIAPAAFLRRAYERGRVKVVDDFAAELSTRIEQELARS